MRIKYSRPRFRAFRGLAHFIYDLRLMKFSSVSPFNYDQRVDLIKTRPRERTWPKIRRMSKVWRYHRNAFNVHLISLVDYQMSISFDFNADYAVTNFISRLPRA